MTNPRIVVIGVTGAGTEGLPAAQLKRVLDADLLVGGERQLACFPDATGEKLSLHGHLDAVVERLHRAREAGQRAVVVASGDPLCYGIGTSLRRSFAADELECFPAPSAFQLAFAALAEPWHDAVLLSAHNSPLAEVVQRARQADKAAILTDPHQTPTVVAQALIAGGLPAAAACAVCENLGQADQRIVRATLAQVAEQEFAPLNVLVVFCQKTRQEGKSPGVDDAVFSTTGGLLTHREVRLLSLAELALQAGEVLWDIGAGSGAVGIEAARTQPAAAVYAVERRDMMLEHIRENLRRLPAPNLRLVMGSAPDVCPDLPDPHAVFVGGSGGHLEAIIALAQQRLHRGGRLVIALVTLENLQRARAYLPDARVAQVQVSVGVPTAGMLRFEAHNPVFLLTWRKGEEG
ncbi:MAG: precorrin-6y C5,15-methyltransferase (decarboxylating) subunit CbiE [Chloroflexaceae bacterium]|nr:precorrin-6y C5,15-methyltransferase (decarboxylating) subunit CbiE [Chloroflexaceae bacterium]